MEEEKTGTATHGRRRECFQPLTSEKMASIVDLWEGQCYLWEDQRYLSEDQNYLWEDQNYLWEGQRYLWDPADKD